jgi:hypothetical protein
MVIYSIVVYGCPYTECIKEGCSVCPNKLDFTWMAIKSHGSFGFAIACDRDLIIHAPQPNQDTVHPWCLVQPWSLQEINAETASVPPDALERMKHWARKNGLPEPSWYMALEMGDGGYDVLNKCKHRQD